MNDINNKMLFLNAEIYAPLCVNDDEKEWIDLYDKISGTKYDYASSFLTVKDVANFIIKNPDYSGGIVKIIKDRSENFQFEKFSIEACPSRFDNSKRIFLRGGNKRSIAYAIRILNGEKFYPIKVCNWINHFERRDTKDMGIHCCCMDY